MPKKPFLKKAMKKKFSKSSPPPFTRGKVSSSKKASASYRGRKADSDSDDM